MKRRRPPRPDSSSSSRRPRDRGPAPTGSTATLLTRPLDQRAIGAVLARSIEQQTGIEARQVVLGHLQRGGSPTAIDRLRATRFGNAAVDLVEAGKSGVLPVQRAGRTEVATMADAVREVRRLSDDYVELVRRFAGVLG